MNYTERQNWQYGDWIVRYPNPRPKYDWDHQTYRAFDYRRGILEKQLLSLEFLRQTLPTVIFPDALTQMKPGDTLERPPFEFECDANCFTAFGIAPPAYGYDLALPHARMLDIVNDGHTRLIRADWSSNNYGEFIFITIADPDTQFALDFFGRGYHEYRGVYYHDWHGSTGMHNAFLYNGLWEQNLQEKFTGLLTAYPAPYPRPQPSRQQQTFGLLADVLDDDGALIELEDNPYLGDWLDDNDE